MAKRSARRARTQGQAEPSRPADPSPQATPSRSRGRGFWTGVLAGAAVLVPIAVVLTLLLSGGDDPSAADAARATATPAAGSEQDEAALRQAAATRDKEQIKALTERARSMSEDFAPVVAGIGKTLPPGSDEIGPLASPADLEEWRNVVRDAAEYFAETESGETATNVARSGLGNAVGILRESLESYRLALEDRPARDLLLRRAAAQRDLAARAWSTAAIQLDVINIDAGYGHQHVTFPSSGGEGAVAPDSLPEGTDAHAGEAP